MAKKAILVITDGIGYSAKTDYNAFFNATKPTYDTLFKTTPYSLIDTFGLSVGLPEGQMGNSEVGHMTLGSGRILYQDLVKISLALKDGSLETNSVLKELLDSSQRVHLVGLMSDGGVHSHIDHFLGFAKIGEKNGKKVFLHLITDGRDVSPTSAPKFLEQVKTVLNDNIKIATISGRFYSMDRDNRWDRVEKGYKAIVNATPKTTKDVFEYVKDSYAKNETDEFILPTAFTGYDGFCEGDSVLTINFRSDRMREMATALADPDFKGFAREYRKISFATITEYDKSFIYPVLFRKDTPKNTLAELISNAGLRQLHTAETEKYAHVTFFLNGGIDEPYNNETRVLIPSPQVKTYDEQPQMSAPAVGDAVVNGIKEGIEFIVVNFANGDMVGHTGDFEAAKLAVSAVDAELGKIMKHAKEHDYSVVITSDHGNCEEMRDDNGEILTNHTVGKVWCFVSADGVDEVQEGGLNNIAATILKLMELQIPKEMDKPLI
ncbi:MAG: 2,3-bisphosphoglycerate-independent phosphoglycerate mutase [Sulfurimonadaceae bacterium]|nr:2,3-bisphosphoglycerate-independent phosphoglycerate mutase [Sulfurimonadaceae bacterium]